MSQRTKVTGTRSCVLWLLVLIAVVLLVGVAAGALFILPQIRAGQASEQHYQAGITFQNIGDWAAAEEEYKQVIALDASYKDVQTRLAEVKARLAESAATATAMAVAQAEQARADAQATSSAAVTATAMAQADAQATAAAAPTATAEALEAHYQKGLGYMNMRRWEEAKAELSQVFEVDPNYKDVQAKLMEVEAEIAKLTPAAAPTPIATPTTLLPVRLFSDSSWKSSAEEAPGWEALPFDDSWWSTVEELDFGNPDRISNMDSRAKWIWHPHAQNSYNVPFFFRKKLELASRPSVASITISVDDGYYLYVNGSSVGSDAGWHAWEVAEKYDIASFLMNGENVIAVKAINIQQEGWLLVSVFIKY